MKIKHTKGPWQYPYRGQVPKQKKEGFIIQTNTNTIATTLGTSVEDEANARLIAAAPELLDTLKGTAKALKRALERFDPDNTDYEWIGEAHEIIYKIETP